MEIIAAIGLNSFEKSVIKKIILAGARVLRYNFSYRTTEENIAHIQTGRRAIEDLNSSVKILIDMPLNKIRLGDFDIKFFPVKEGQEVVFKCASFSTDCNQYIPVNTDRLDDKVQQGQTITIGDGEILTQVKEIIDPQTIKAKVLNNGYIRYTRTLNMNWLPGKEQTLTRYREIIEKTQIVNPDYIALSYIDSDFKEKIKQIPYIKNQKTKIVAKIERLISLEELKDLCQDPFYDIIMLDRGEMGVNTAFEKNCILQKQITRIALKYRKPVIVSTHILESSMNDLIPYRAEIADLTNIVLDGASAIMLCHETAVGKRPAYTISVAKKIIDQAQKYKEKIKSIKKNQT
ncbi:MAG: pyruvate kinase [bacterium]